MILLASFAFIAAGCAPAIGAREQSFNDRCADFMDSAFPDSGIKVTDHRLGLGDNQAVVDLTGVRGKVAPGTPTLARDVAVECRFDHGVLTEFRWTGGPF